MVHLDQFVAQKLRQYILVSPYRNRPPKYFHLYLLQCHYNDIHYNGYFNAREIYKAKKASTYEEHKDDFSEIIPLFVYPDETQAKAMYPDMDKIVEKTSTVIDRHSIYIKKYEYNRWIDDSYMLMGKARFYKQEYFVGEEVFEYIAKAFKKQDVKFDALIWLAKTQMELNAMNKAESYLT